MDSSALVKLIVAEPESAKLETYLEQSQLLVTSRLASVEVARAVRVAVGSEDVLADAEVLLASCMTVELSDHVARRAGDLASSELRSLDAIHLASCERSGAATMVTYDQRLLKAARAIRVATASPGADG